MLDADQERAQADRRLLHGRPGLPQPHPARRSTAPRSPTPRSTRSATSRRACRRSTRSARSTATTTINADTKVFGVIGDPVGHSLSPLIHNPAFRQAGHQRRLPAVPRAARRRCRTSCRPSTSPGAGLQRDHPAQGGGRRRWPTVKDPTVERTQAANTLVRARRRLRRVQHRLQAVHRHAARLLPTFAPSTPSARDVPTRRPTAPVGPGQPAPTGAVTSSAAAGRAGGSSISGRGWRCAGGRRRGPGGGPRPAPRGGAGDHRQPHRRAGAALAEEVGCRHVDWNARHSVLCDLVINCTSVGMHPNVDEIAAAPQLPQAGAGRSSTRSTRRSRRC